MPFSGTPFLIRRSTIVFSPIRQLWIFADVTKAFVFNVPSMVHPKTGAPLMKKCTVLQREGCTCAAEHQKSISTERPIA